MEMPLVASFKWKRQKMGPYCWSLVNVSKIVRVSAGGVVDTSLAIRTRGWEFESYSGHTNNIKNSLSIQLECNIAENSKPVLSSRWMLHTWLPYPNRELKALGLPTQDPKQFTWELKRPSLIIMNYEWIVRMLAIFLLVYSSWFDIQQFWFDKIFSFL